MEESHYHSQEEYLRDKEMHERGIYGNHLSSLLDDAKERLKKLKKSPKENHWQIKELEKQIAVMEKEANLPEPKTDTRKFVGMRKLKEKLAKPINKALEDDMASPHKGEELEILDEILQENRRHTKRLDVIVTLLEKVTKHERKKDTIV